MSAGIKGARIGFSGRGTHVTLGAGGIYYSQRVGAKRRAASFSAAAASDDWSIKQAEFEAKVRDAEDDAAMNRLTDSTSQAFVDELESKPHQFVFFKPALIAGLIALLFFFSYAFEQNHDQLRVDKQPMLKVLGAGLLVAWVALLVWLRRLDERRKMMFVNYTMDDSLRQLYDKFMECFQEFASTARVWHTVGTRQTVTRNVIQDISPHRLPSPHLVINVSVPYIRLPDKELYFFPERIIFRRGRQLGAVFYKHIQITREDVQLRESDGVPADATVVDHAGDKRPLPICRYTQYTFTSAQGWNDTIMTSRVGAMDRFAEFIKLIGQYQQKVT